MKKVAIFDFDGTLYPEETFKLMMNHLKGHSIHKKKYRRFISKVLPVYIAYKLKLYPEQKMKEFSMRSYISAFGHTSKEEIELFFTELALKMTNEISKPVLRRLYQHHKDGYYIMLVSGAFLPLLQAISNKLPIDSIIGTSIPFKQDKIDPHTTVIHIHGERKKNEIFLALTDEVDWGNSFAYGDSFSDLIVLELVGNPVAVKPEQRLLDIATARNWEVL